MNYYYELQDSPRSTSNIIFRQFHQIDLPFLQCKRPLLKSPLLLPEHSAFKLSDF